MASKIIGIDLGTTNSVVSVMEGGYNVPILAGCVAAHLQAMGAEVD